jgi:hypothetical protein
MTEILRRKGGSNFSAYLDGRRQHYHSGLKIKATMPPTAKKSMNPMSGRQIFLKVGLHEVKTI